jgi:outer membrane protein TolC
MALRTPILLLFVFFFACSPASYRREADDQVYSILEYANAKVTGRPTVFNIDRPVDTLRARLLSSTEPVQLSLLDALDVAAENSREFQLNKEGLYRAALALTGVQNNFAVQWDSNNNSARISGTGNDDIDADFDANLNASALTVAGTELTLGFMQALTRSITPGGDLVGAGGNLLSLGIFQPLLRGAGVAVNREPLTQAERNVIYEIRDFERSRRSLAVGIVSDYYGVVQTMENLKNLSADLVNRQTNYNRADALFEAGRGSLDDVDRAEQDLLTAQNRVVDSEANLQTQLDRFKQALGLPTDSIIDLDINELVQLQEQGVIEVELDQERAVELALSRRYDYQTDLDLVDRAARNVVIQENDLESVLNFDAGISLPQDGDNAWSVDWSQVSWDAGFELNLALNRLPERNDYRRALIDLDVAIRAREASEDRIKAEVRLDLRDIQQNLQNYRVDESSLRLAERRVESTVALFAADRVRQLDVNDAQDALIASQVALVNSLVSYNISRLQLMNDLEALMLEPKGLRYDPGLILPDGPLLSDPDNPENPVTPPAPGNGSHSPENRP